VCEELLSLIVAAVGCWADVEQHVGIFCSRIVVQPADSTFFALLLLLLIHGRRAIGCSRQRACGICVSLPRLLLRCCSGAWSLWTAVLFMALHMAQGREATPAVAATQRWILHA